MQHSKQNLAELPTLRLRSREFLHIQAVKQVVVKNDNIVLYDLLNSMMSKDFYLLTFVVPYVDKNAAKIKKATKRQKTTTKTLKPQKSRKKQNNSYKKVTKFHQLPVKYGNVNLNGNTQASRPILKW